MNKHQHYISTSLSIRLLFVAIVWIKACISYRVFAIAAVL